MLHFFTVAVPEAFVGLHRTKTSKDLRSKLTTVRSKASKSESSGLVQTSAWHPFKIYGSVSVRHFSTTAVPAQSGAQIAETANLSFDKSLSITMYSDLSLGLVHTPSKISSAPSGSVTFAGMLCTPFEKSPLRDTPILYQKLCFELPRKASASHCVTCLPASSGLLCPEISTAEEIWIWKFNAEPKSRAGIIISRSYSLSETFQLNFWPNFMLPLHARSGPVSLLKTSSSVVQLLELAQFTQWPAGSRTRMVPTSAMVVEGFTKPLALSFKRNSAGDAFSSRSLRLRVSLRP